MLHVSDGEVDESSFYSSTYPTSKSGAGQGAIQSQSRKPSIPHGHRQLHTQPPYRIGGLCCLLVVVIVAAVFIGLYLSPTASLRRRGIEPELVNFVSRFDKYCRYTYNPNSVSRAKRQTANNRSFVTHGLRVQEGSYQYVVLEDVKIKLTNPGSQNSATCTGSLIDERHVLTAGHCVVTEEFTQDQAPRSDFVDPRAVTSIRLGVQGSSDNDLSLTVRADAIYLHSDYDFVSNFSTDIALVRLNRDVTFNNNIKPVCLAGSKDVLPAQCVGMGFGQTQSGGASSRDLNRASGIDTHSGKECSKGALLNATVDQFGKINPDADSEYLRIYYTNYLPVYFRGKLCSLTNRNLRSICDGDSGGPLMCTPDGVKTNENYHNSASALSRQTDPTLKQFAVNVAGIGECGVERSVSVFVSLQAMRLWLEFVAWPAVQKVKETKEKEKLRHDECMDNLDWDEINSVVMLSGSHTNPLEDRHQVHICKKLNIYMNCCDNSPDVAYCDHLYATILNTLDNVARYVDLLPFFKTERCRQLKNTKGCLTFPPFF